MPCNVVEDEPELTASKILHGSRIIGKVLASTDI